jgi:hypothetical protein
MLGPIQEVRIQEQRVGVGQASEHDADHCETDERRGGSRVALEVASEAPIVADPGERLLDSVWEAPGSDAVHRA